MSRSAGRVLIIPCGDYDATRTYQMLDSVEYNGTSYLCKQQSTGNLPTNKTYWQAMGAAGSGVSNFITLSEDERVSYGYADIEKAAGSDEDVTVTFTVDNEDITRASNIYRTFYPRIGQKIAFVGGGGTLDMTITSVTEAPDASYVSIVGKLVQDTTSAISVTHKIVYLYTYNDESTGSIVGAGGSAVTNRGVAFGEMSTASGEGAVAMGDQTAASGECSVAEGYQTTASSSYTHAEGYGTYVNGTCSHGEGRGIWVRGNYSHGGGKNTSVSGDNSFAHGEGLNANRDHQLIAGKYNDDYPYSNKTPVMAIGNGTSGNRQNAFTVYMDGFISCGAGHNRFKLTKENGAWGFYDNSNVFHAIGAIELVQSVTLDTTGETTVTFSNAAITEDANLEVLTNVFGLYPSDMVSSGSNHTCTVKFPQADSADTINVKLRIS